MSAPCRAHKKSASTLVLALYREDQSHPD